MLQFFSSAVGYASVAFYLYVAVLFFRAEYRANAQLDVAFLKALVWPATAWDTIEKLYETTPSK
jgi:hypothetical protein